MRNKIGLLGGCLIAALCTTANSEQMVPDVPALSNVIYNVTFYSEPNLTTGYTVCFSFTKTGGVLGYANSGTFTTGNSTWNGEWYQDGDEVVIVGGVPSNDSEAIPMIGKVLGGSKISGRYVDSFADGTYDFASEGAAGNFFGNKATGGCTAQRPAGNSKKLLTQ